MRETLRLGPPASFRATAPWEDTTLKGKYPLAKDSTISCAIYIIHRDTKVWGEDVSTLFQLEYNFIHEYRPRHSAPSAC